MPLTLCPTSRTDGILATSLALQAWPCITTLEVSSPIPIILQTTTATPRHLRRYLHCIFQSLEIQSPADVSRWNLGWVCEYASAGSSGMGAGAWVEAEAAGRNSRGLWGPGRAGTRTLSIIWLLLGLIIHWSRLLLPILMWFLPFSKKW